MILIPRPLIDIPPGRQRGDLDSQAVAELRDSIEAVGLLHPIVVSRDAKGRYLLRAGENRLAALGLLHAEGLTYNHGDAAFTSDLIACTDFGELSPLQAFRIELEENLRRKDLPWQKQHAALAKLYELEAGAASHIEAVRNTAAIAYKVTPEDVTARAAGVPKIGVIAQKILLGQHLSDPDIAGARTAKDAMKILLRKQRKEQDSHKATPTIPNLFQGDIRAILPTFPDAHFDGVCSDPPYGIGISQFSTQSSSEQEYDDSPETWLPLMEYFTQQLSRILRANAFGYLFCDLANFATLRTLVEKVGFEAFPRPLIWDRSPDGRLTTPEKWPRRCYECILYFRRGDRPLYEVRSDVLRYPADRDTRNYHGAKKPVDLFVDLLERTCRPGDRVLDPFAGSGPLLRAGRKLHLETWLVEKDPGYFGLIQTLLEGDTL